MRYLLIVSVVVLAWSGRAAAQTPLLPALAPPPLTPTVTSSAAESGVRLALVQPPDAPVVLEAVAHVADRLAGAVRLRNRTDRTVSAVIVAFTLGTGPESSGPAFRHLEAVTVTLPSGEADAVDVPGVPVSVMRGLLAGDAPVLEVAIVGVRFTSGPAWQARGRGSWLGRPDVTAPLACVDDLGQTQNVDALTALTAGTSVCQGGGQ
jgi:hypothetical protein